MQIKYIFLLEEWLYFTLFLRYTLSIWWQYFSLRKNGSGHTERLIRVTCSGIIHVHHISSLSLHRHELNPVTGYDNNFTNIGAIKILLYLSYQCQTILPHAGEIDCSTWLCIEISELVCTCNVCEGMTLDHTSDRGKCGPSR